MDWTWYLFRFEGRINRAKYWLAGLVVVCWMASLAALMALTTKIHQRRRTRDVRLQHRRHLRAGRSRIAPCRDRRIPQRRMAQRDDPACRVFPCGAERCCSSWVYAATSIKRLHDRDKSGWWIVPFFVIPGLYRQFRAIGLRDSCTAVTFSGWSSAFLRSGASSKCYCLRGDRGPTGSARDPLPKIQTRSRGEPRARRAGTSRASWNLFRTVLAHRRDAHVKRGHD